MRRKQKKILSLHIKNIRNGYLWQERGKAVSRKLLEEITGANGDGNMVAVYISRLRSKLEEATDKKIILTVRDIGYRISR
jgi:DNA-binding response OmpR family regulator